MAHIQKRGEGRWKARYRGPDGKEYSRTFKTKTAAQKWVNKAEVAKQEGTWIDPRRGKMRFEELAKDVLDSRLNLRPATMAKYDSYLRRHLLPRFGNIPINMIDRRRVQDWVKHEIAAGYAPAMIQGCHALLSSILSEAVAEGLISQSPCQRVRLPKTTVEEKRFLDAEEVQRLIQAMPERYQALVAVAAWLGLRWQEVAGLKVKHLNLMRGELTVAGVIERVAGSYRYVEDTKSAESRRTIKMPRFLVEMLSEHLITQKFDSELLSNGPKVGTVSPTVRPTGATVAQEAFVFQAPEGGFLRYDNFRRRVWDPAVKRAGLGKFGFHSLRHTAAALMIDQVPDPLQVAKRLGHADIRTTYKHYGHRFPNREDELNESLEMVYRKAAAASPRPEVVVADFGSGAAPSSTRENDGGRYWDRTSDLCRVKGNQGTSCYLRKQRKRRLEQVI
jgi:integrase